MTEHEQVPVRINRWLSFTVDKGLEKIIKNFWDWKLETDNSCIDNNGRIWISFLDFENWESFLQLVLKHRNTINVDSYVRETLWDFLQAKAAVSVAFDESFEFDPDDANAIIGTGDLVQSISLRFPKEYFEDFTKLLFEVLPPK